MCAHCVTQTSQLLPPWFPGSVAFHTFNIYILELKLACFFLRLRVNLVAKEDADDVEAVEAAKVNGNENGNEVRQKSPRKDVPWSFVTHLCCKNWTIGPQPTYPTSLLDRFPTCDKNRSSLTPEHQTPFFRSVQEQAGTKKKAKKPLDSTWLCWCWPFQFALQVVLEWSTLKRKPDRLRDVEGMTSDFLNYPPSVGVPRKKKNKSKQGHRFPKERVQADPVIRDTHFLHSIEVTEAWVRSNCCSCGTALHLFLPFDSNCSYKLTSTFQPWGIVWNTFCLTRGA